MRKILKTLIIIILTAAVVLGIIWAVLTVLSAKRGTTLSRTAGIEPVAADASDDELTEYIKTILVTIKDRDYKVLASVVHPDYGVIFSPYATVNLSTDRCFTSAQIADFLNNTKKYIWGVYDGIGEPIEMTPSGYFDRFVYDTDFVNCENYGIDEVLRVGNSLENVEEVFAGARYVDCYMPDPKGESEPDWRSLRLVFEEYKGKLLLTAIIHSEYTI